MVGVDGVRRHTILKFSYQPNGDDTRDIRGREQERVVGDSTFRCDSHHYTT